MTATSAGSPDVGPFTPPPLSYRHPLGLPAGSIRSTLVLMIMLPVWLILLNPAHAAPQPLPLFLYFMTGLVMLYFYGDGSSSGIPIPGGRARPFGLPAAVLRWLVLAVTMAIVVYRANLDQAALMTQLTPTEGQMKQWPWLLLALLGGFGSGWLLQQGPWRTSYWFQDVQAWVSLLAMLGLLAETLIHLFISPSLGRELDLSVWESILTAVVACYFGFRA